MAMDMLGCINNPINHLLGAIDSAEGAACLTGGQKRDVGVDNNSTVRALPACPPRSERDREARSLLTARG